MFTTTAARDMVDQCSLVLCLQHSLLSLSLYFFHVPFYFTKLLLSFILSLHSSFYLPVYSYILFLFSSVLNGALSFTLSLHFLVSVVLVELEELNTKRYCHKITLNPQLKDFIGRTGLYQKYSCQYSNMDSENQ